MNICVWVLAAPETEELMAELKAGSGRVSIPIGDRSKVRLLVTAASQCQHINGLEQRDSVRRLERTVLCSAKYYMALFEPSSHTH